MEGLGLVLGEARQGLLLAGVILTELRKLTLLHMRVVDHQQIMGT